MIAGSNRRSQAGCGRVQESYKSRGGCAAKVRLARSEYDSVRLNEALRAQVEAAGGDQVGERRQGLSQISAE